MNELLNNSKDWGRVISAPSFDVQGYQDKIDKICGLNPLGKPNVKLTWMPDAENWSYRYTTWDSGGFGVKKELRAQYVFETVGGIDIPPPRWTFKQWMSGAQYATTDNQTRWQRRETGRNQVEVRESRPPLPVEGCYVPHPSPLLRVAAHNGQCCMDAQASQTKCWGSYREPDESYLILLKQAVKRRDAENAQNPNEPLSEETLKQAAMEAGEIIKAKKEAARANLEGWVDENWQEVFADYTGDKELFPHKEYSISKGGIILPK